ncbi:RNA-binding protein 24 isoform X3 [Neltuma alba]|uniref:RNA-binding protein 24 isoform X3 n=1 Tax=Neltuma alba TaxID=207710 RepID=UPI0010A52D99|nr:RNA-binding protein 24-like isoform X3 [Prosopis alba]
MLIMSQQRQFQMVGGQYNDTTLTKIFVGGLAWETQRDTMRRYFEPFGEILEAVVITDKNTGRSKGYGFVTFKDPEAAMRACQNPSPVIDGRRANCNLASLGANKNRPPTPQLGTGRFRAAPGLVGVPAYHGSSSTVFRSANCGEKVYSDLSCLSLKMSTGEVACTYAVLILHDDNIPVTAEKISTLVKAANVDVESYWPSLFAKLAEKRNIEDLILNAGGGGAPVAVAAPAAAAAGGGAAPPPPAEEKKEEPQEESDDDMGFSLFD